MDRRTAKPSKISTVCGFRILSTEIWFRNPNFGGKKEEGRRGPQQSRGGRDQKCRAENGSDSEKAGGGGNKINVINSLINQINK